MYKNWQDREKNGESIRWDIWNPRMKRIYDLIADDILENRIRSVMDMGAGEMYLRNLLSEKVAYFPVDYFARYPDTLVCDFNLKQFPKENVDVIIAAGVLPFITDAKWFFEEAFQHCRQKFVLTYTPMELEENMERREKVYLWRNHYTYPQLCRLLYDSGFLLTHVEKRKYEECADQIILVAEKASPETLPKMMSCTGCGVCAECCPSGALELSYDREGFLRPVFHEAKCVHCNICMERCPALHFESKNNPEPKTFAVWAPDELRLQSSSGGAFSLLALEIIRQRGAVCGVRYEPGKQQVEHVIIRSEKELSELRGSKYVQSDMQNVYQSLRLILENEEVPVLFCGCPCQVSALNSCLGHKYKNLYTVDLLCAGVTAPGVFQRYMAENWDVDRVTNVNCRIKDFGWNPHFLKVEFRDGSNQIVHRETDPFEQLFHSFAGQRESCYACTFSTFPRQGDITLGDFWGVQNYDAALDDGKGTSFVSINSEKGEKLFNLCLKSAVMIRNVPWQYTGTNRVSTFLSERVALPETRERLYHLLSTHSFRDAVELTINAKYDVAVPCNWSGDNYGAQLTQYAFYRILTEMGLETIMIERPDMPFPGGNAETARLFRRNPYPEYATHKLFKNTDEMRAMNDLADIFIVPSDQLWNALFAEKDLFALGYVANNKKKIAYATSFGCYPHNWKEDERAREAFFLSRFDAISVREDSGVKILRESFNIVDVEQTLDPVFLHDANFYTDLCGFSRYNDQNIGIASFILDPSIEKEKYISWICEELNLKSIQIGDVNYHKNNKKKWGLSVENNIMIEDWIAVIRNSEFVVTDSFHGICLAIIFQKQFIAIGNTKRGLARFESILKQFDLMDRLVLNPKERNASILHRKIDYFLVMRILKKQQRNSLNWLKTAIAKPKQANLTTYDVLDREIIQQKNMCKERDAESAIAFQKLDSRQAGIDKELLRINDNIDKINAELLRINKNHDLVNAELLRINQWADKEEKNHSNSISAINAELIRINGNIDAINEELLNGKKSMSAVLLALNEKSQLISELCKRLTDLETSFSYRIGKLVTWLPRKVMLFFRNKRQ